MTNEPEMRVACPDDTSAVTALFAEIVAGGNERWFHPHPFTAESAAALCSSPTRDLYLVARAGDECLAWGMLRGWEADYVVPSLGIYVAERARGIGLGRAFMDYLHRAAASRAAPAVRLKVYPDNQRALALYRRLGYQFATTLDNGQLMGRLDLSASRLAMSAPGA